MELSEHLGYDKHDPPAQGSGNSRNGSDPSSRSRAIRTRRAGSILPTRHAKYWLQILTKIKKAARCKDSASQDSTPSTVGDE